MCELVLRLRILLERIEGLQIPRHVISINLIVSFYMYDLHDGTCNVLKMGSR